MNHPVMSPAEQNQVAELGLPSVQPVATVMAVAPGRRPVAAGKAAMAVPHDQGSSDRRGDGSGSPSHIEGLRGPIGDYTGDAGIADVTAGKLGVDGAGLVELADLADPMRQAVEVNDKTDVGTFASGFGLTMIKPLPADLGESVGPPLVGRRHLVFRTCGS
jgi:hypothetical protein